MFANNSIQFFRIAFLWKVAIFLITAKTKTQVRKKRLQAPVNFFMEKLNFLLEMLKFELWGLPKKKMPIYKEMAESKILTKNFVCK